MVDIKTIENQLKQIGCNVDVWGRTELHELAKVLTPEEKIASVVNGVYEGGFALLCVTDLRVLLVDKKPLLLTVEDLRYDMIVEVDYSAHMILASLHVLTPMRTLVFSSWSRGRLHNAMQYVQQRLLEMRNRQGVLQQIVEQKRANMAAPAVPMPMQAERKLIDSYDEDFTDEEIHHMNTVTNPYTKSPMLSRRRRYPSFYSTSSN